MKTNVTLQMDVEVLREARILAAKQGTSISRMLTETLEEMVRRELAYEKSRARALRRLRRGYDLDWRPAYSRDHLHDRGEPR